jgi:hypothetical protein
MYKGVGKTMKGSLAPVTNRSPLSPRQMPEPTSFESDVLQENALKISEEELEVPAFMRKKISTK